MIIIHTYISYRILNYIASNIFIYHVYATILISVIPLHLTSAFYPSHHLIPSDPILTHALTIISNMPYIYTSRHLRAYFIVSSSCRSTIIDFTHQIYLTLYPPRISPHIHTLLLPITSYLLMIICHLLFIIIIVQPSSSNCLLHSLNHHSFLIDHLDIVSSRPNLLLI
jgi:hypothetical protein